MKRSINKFLAVFVLLVLSNGVFISFTHAASTDPTNKDFQLVPTDCAQSAGSPQCGWTNLLELVNNIINFVVIFSAVIATIAFCYAGFLYVTAFGDMGKVEKAHGIFSKTMVGILFILLAWLIVATILKVMNANPDVVTTINFSNVKNMTGK